VAIHPSIRAAGGNRYDMRWAALWIGLCSALGHRDFGPKPLFCERDWARALEASATGF
jgi:hypothetical protein